MADVFVIAEAGVNHDGDEDRALALVDAAAAAGADAFKTQTFRPEALATALAPTAAYQQAATGAAAQRAMLERLALSSDAHHRLARRCRQRGILFLSTPFDAASADLLVNEVGVDRLKVSSGDLTNGPLLLHLARTGLPVILSTGMGTLAEVAQALAILAFGWTAPADASPGREAFSRAMSSKAGLHALAGRVTLLHCTTAYPADPADANLAAMSTLGAAFGLPVGYSDHTPGIAVAIAAAALGAVAVEKHLTLDRTLPGPDHAASLEPDAFAAMVQGIRIAATAVGHAAKAPAAAELANAAAARRSLVALRPIAAGEPFSLENVGARRPAGGLSPMLLWDLLGRPAPRAFAPDEMVRP